MKTEFMPTNLPKRRVRVDFCETENKEWDFFVHDFFLGERELLCTLPSRVHMEEHLAICLSDGDHVAIHPYIPETC